MDSKMSVEDLHKELMSMTLGDLCLLCGQAINQGFDKERVDLMLKYLELKMRVRKLTTKEENEKNN